ncbi:MAG: tripartite tricarboxylate transporter substrate binding protein [Pseudomonadota bacterium]
MKRPWFLVVLIALASVASAQSYPTRPIRLIVPYPPGGGTDTVARLIAQPLTERLGQQVVVDNRGGASGIIGTDMGARAAPDGYTLVFCLPASVSVNPTYYQNLPYDPARDFAPVIQLNTIALLLVTTPSLPASNVNELIALARAKPGQFNFASSGNGSAAHLAMELFNMMAGVKMVHVPYKGGGPALTDIISGQMHMMSGPLIAALPHVKSGRIRAMAVTTERRVKGLPEVPTIAESLPGYESSIWHGVVVPRGVPVAVVNRLNREIGEILKIPEVQSRLDSQGAEPVGGTPGKFAALIKSDTAKYAKLLRDVGLAGSARR